GTDGPSAPELLVRSRDEALDPTCDGLKRAEIALREFARSADVLEILEKKQIRHLRRLGVCWHGSLLARASPRRVEGGRRTYQKCSVECHPAARDPLDAAETTGHIPGVPRPGLREQLLAAGLATFHERGFNATSVQDITDAAGAPKGSFYNHFESKEALAAEAVRRYAERGRKRFALLRED